MRILFSTFTYPPERNGVALASAREVKTLIALGHTVDVVTGTVPVADQHVEGPGNVSRFKFRGNGSLWRPVRGEKQILANWMASRSWDLVILAGWQNWATDVVLDLLENQLYDGPVILRSHGISTNTRVGPFMWWLPRYVGWRFYYWYQAPRILQRICLLVPLSGREDNDRFLDVSLARKKGISIEPIPNTAPTFKIVSTGSSSSNRVKFCSKIFLCIGNFSTMKNERYVLEAYRESGLLGIPIVFVGPSLNAYSAGMQRMAARSNLTNVHIVDAPSEAELYALYANSLAVVSGSLTECQPLVLLDALYFGVPFISTALSSVASLQGGVVVTSQLQMATEMVRIAEDAHHRSTLVEAGKFAFTTHFSEEVVMKLWAALMMKVSHRRTSSSPENPIALSA